MYDNKLHFDITIFIHKVVSNVDRYFLDIFDENYKVNQLLNWCRKNCDYSYVMLDYRTICFRNKDDALKFKLTWG